jgi:type II restriction/modification system DNA methylase subunit YeeA
LSDTKDQVIERVAYIWFNRFCALRFMDVNRYNRVGIVSPADPGQFQPEILAEAKMGHVDEEMVPEKIRQQIFALLGGTAPSQDPQAEAYRLLVVAACNDYHKAMPYLFERIADYTELLMPDDLLSGNSILAYTREAMTPNICQDVEVIGWLYQFYISEKKDKVFDDLKKNKKITPENIPAATQLFTPHWIVRYLVENSLGRLWMLNRPDSKIFQNMKDLGKECYYIEPSEPEIDFLRINKPEDLKLCDPACGSGHMLVYAFDLLFAIYEEEGVDPSEIPEKILTHNLFGIEIDERAGELAAFALTMKARAKQRRFFRKPVQPNICVLQAIHFDETEINEYMDFVGQDIFTLGLKTTLSQFEEADNFGSLIRPEVTNVQGMLEILNTKDLSSHLFYSLTHAKVLQVLKQADYLSPKYHVVIANPPYIGGRNMNPALKSYLVKNFEDSKSDMFSASVHRFIELCLSNAFVGIMSPNVWMFLTSYEKFRKSIILKNSLISLVELPLTGFKGATVQICAYLLQRSNLTKSDPVFIRLVDYNKSSDDMEILTIDAIKDIDCQYRYTLPRSTFLNQLKAIPGQPIAYWAPYELRLAFEKMVPLGDIAEPVSGMFTTNNDLFLRHWHEVSWEKVNIDAITQSDANKSGARWFPYNKGGSYRKWYGNCEWVVNFENNGKTICDYIDNAPGAKVKSNGRIVNRDKYFKKSITWTSTSSSYFGVRHSDSGFIFDIKGSSCFSTDNLHLPILGFLASKITTTLLALLNPTVEFQNGNIKALPISPELINEPKRSILESLVSECVHQSRVDWDNYEFSWRFNQNPLVTFHLKTLKESWSKLQEKSNYIINSLLKNEIDINEIIFNAYSVESISDLSKSNITLFCNPNFRYGSENSEEELEILLLTDTIKEFISYAVGCMFGRYALDKPGLILANQGETIADYLKQIPEPIFSADDDNVIPMLDGDWFTDDVTERFGQFLKVTFGDANYEDNLKFIEQALGKDIRKYFLKDFYNDHLKRYKKRPIYWLFSSPKGTFNAMIYMHRYRPDTVSVVLNDYLREFRTKLSAHKNHLEAVSISSNASAGEKTKALKDIENHRKMIDELDVYEREVLYPLATEQVEIDLDDGVKVNYQKFGEALKKIPGLAAKDD